VGKSLFIIGSGPGISAATAERFGKEGWKIVLGARNADRRKAQSNRLRDAGIESFDVEVDASDPASVRRAVAAAETLTGGLTAILFNAVSPRQQDFLSLTDAEIESDLATNIGGALATIRAAAETFGSLGGVILLTGGGFALYPQADWSTLSIGKAGIRNVAQGLHSALAARNIRIGTVTVATFVQPNSKETADVADRFWELATNPASGWEIVYPSTDQRAVNSDHVVPASA
jgi:NAD(P)-dependent dehydrogenase (short-subunit alcohol dehydrogenase family)